MEEAKAKVPRFRPRSNYFVKGDLVWVRPARLPYWPAEVLSSDEGLNLVRARLFFPPSDAELLKANLQAEERFWEREAKKRQERLRKKESAKSSGNSSKKQRVEGLVSTADASHSSGEGAVSEERGEAEAVPAAEADVVTSNGLKVYFFDKMTTVEELDACIEDRLQRQKHDVSGYEDAFVKAVRHVNRMVRIALDPEKLRPYNVCGVGIVYSLMRNHVAAPRQPHTGTFEPQTAVIRLQKGMENAARDLMGFEYIWVLFQFSYAAPFATGEGQDGVRRLRETETEATGGGEGEAGVALDALTGWRNRKGVANTAGFKTMVVPPRDDVLRGVFATRSPHRPNFIGLSCVRLVLVQGLDIHIADHDLLHGTPVLDIKPYLPFCDAHPDARAGWVGELDASGKGKADHKYAAQATQVDRVLDVNTPNDV